MALITVPLEKFFKFLVTDILESSILKAELQPVIHAVNTSNMLPVHSESAHDTIQLPTVAAAPFVPIPTNVYKCTSIQNYKKLFYQFNTFEMFSESVFWTLPLVANLATPFFCCLCICRSTRSYGYTCNFASVNFSVYLSWLHYAQYRPVRR